MNGVHEAYQLIALSITAPASIMHEKQVPVNVLDLARSLLRQSAHVLSFQEKKNTQFEIQTFLQARTYYSKLSKWLRKQWK